MSKKKRRAIGAAFALILVVSACTVASPLFAESIWNKSDKTDTEDYLDTFGMVFRFVEENYVDEIDAKTLFDGAMKGLMESTGDPHTVYLQDYFLQDIQDLATGQYGGVGMYITSPISYEDDNSGNLPFVEVVYPFEGSPAYRAGVHAGDLIISINGESAEGLTSEDVADLLRGEEGTDVTVEFLRGKDIVFEATITREILEIPTVKYDMINGNIGYISILQFTPYTTPRFREALLKLRQDGYEALIVDVRNNSGGVLDGAIDVADCFFRDGVIVSTKSRIKTENNVYRATPFQIVDDDIPVYMLINGGSASASEIVTGALKDRDRAVIIGETSYGKGSVQSVIPVLDNAIKMTTSRYYTPNDISIDKIGIEPNIMVEEPTVPEEYIDSYRILLDEDLVGHFVDDHNPPTDKDIKDFKAELAERDIIMDDYTLDILIHNEVVRTMEVLPVFDLEYDPILQEAVGQAEEGMQ